MNGRLESLAARFDLAGTASEPLRLAFGLACVERVQHLLEDPRAQAGFATLRDYVAGSEDAPTLRAAAAELQEVARHHRGSDSIDGSAHAAVSATHALAHAAAGRALEAASYAAYAAVYAYGGYAVNDPSAFEPEVQWQVQCLEKLAAAGFRAARRQLQER